MTDKLLTTANLIQVLSTACDESELLVEVGSYNDDLDHTVRINQKGQGHHDNKGICQI